MRPFTFSVSLTLILTASLAMAATQEPIPVREGEPSPQAPPTRVHPPINPMAGVPVPIGPATAQAGQVDQSRHSAPPAAGQVPVDENARPSEEGGDRSGAPPVAMDDFYTAEANGTLTVSVASGLLANDYDIDGDGLSVILITDGVDHGALAAFTGGNFSYTPDPDFVGYDYFDVRITDGTNSQQESRVHLEVVATDRPPVAVDESYHVAAGEVLDIDEAQGILANDYDPDGHEVSVILISNNVSHGTLSAFTGGHFIYTPNGGFTGTDSFSYLIRANGVTATGTATITVYDGNRAPYAAEDHYYTPFNYTLDIPVSAGLLRNDFDPDGDAISATLITDNVDNGTLAAFADGHFTYTPDYLFFGMDSFTYRMADANGAISSATVYLFVAVTEDQYSATPPDLDSRQFAMSLPAPNPFNPTTRIDFRIDGSARTSLRVYDVRGALVRTLIDEELPAGNHSVQWDGKNDGGASMASGTYFAALVSGENQASQRLTLVK